MFHPFYVKNEDGTGEWKAASNLEAGDELLTEDGKKVFVSEVRVEKLEEEITVYNLELDEVHTYYVALGVLVHNKCATKKNKKENSGGSAGESGTNSATSQNQMQKQVERGKAPKSVDRVDKPHVEGQQPHIHFGENEAALNIDGTWHDEGMKSIPKLDKKTIKWIIKNGWKLPNEGDN